MKPEHSQSTVCGNCGAAMSGDFCSACGQRRAQRLSLRRSLAEAWSHVADLDFALARTFAGMCRRPGALVLEYLAGRRRDYSNPFRYAFIVTTVAVVAIGVLGIDITMPGVPLETERDRAAIRLMTTLMSYLFFPTILVLAWLQWWIGRMGRFTYAEVLVFDAYCLSHAGLFAIVIGPVLPPGQPAGLAVLMTCQVAYVAWCLRGFRGVSWISALGRSLALTIGYIAIFNLIGIGLINALAVTGFF
jgi:hypothetical protein